MRRLQLQQSFKCEDLDNDISATQRRFQRRTSTAILYNGSGICWGRNSREKALRGNWFGRSWNSGEKTLCGNRVGFRGGIRASPTCSKCENGGCHNCESSCHGKQS